MFITAAGQRIDPDRAEKFGKQLDEVYRNPFEKRKKQPYTAAEIKQYMIEKIEEAMQWT